MLELIVSLAVLLELLVVGAFSVNRQDFELHLAVVLCPQSLLFRLVCPSLQAQLFKVLAELSGVRISVLCLLDGSLVLVEERVSICHV